jgi:hypothetical protein
MTPPRIKNGRFTLRNRQTGEHRTFSIRTQKKDARFAPGKRIISLLTGPDNTADYQSFGFVDDNGIHVWEKLRGGKVWHHKKSKYDWFAIMLWEAVTIPRGRFAREYEVMLEGRCVVCNRVLTEPRSIESGIGPVCAGR